MVEMSGVLPWAGEFGVSPVSSKGGSHFGSVFLSHLPHFQVWPSFLASLAVGLAFLPSLPHCLRSDCRLSLATA